MAGKRKQKKPVESLYQNQVLLLQILYKFRFGTNELLAQYRSITRRTVNKSILILLEKGLIDRRYDSVKKIRGESAVYFLTTPGIKYLRTRFTLTDKIVSAVYKNRIVGEPFINYQLAVFRTYLNLQNQYGDRYDVFTKAEMAKFGQYPEQLPDLFLASKNGKNDFMLDIFTHEPFFVIKKRIKYYIEHRNEEWDSGQYPSILLVCPDARNEDKVIKYCESQLEDFDFLVTTVKALNGGGLEIWSNPVEQDELIRL
jgi:DNA-binding MarR family transcriptional regulator